MPEAEIREKKEGEHRMLVGVRAVVRIAYGALMLLFGLTLAGCRQDMQNQPKFIPLRGTTFFADGRSARVQVKNTVARGQLQGDTYFYTGLQNGREGDGMPLPVTIELLERGQERYNIFCAPCHSRVGNGSGMIVMRGYSKAVNFHIPRLRSAPLGHFFVAITNGYGLMPDYAAQIAPEDRWAIVAYIRALERSQNASLSDVPPGERVQSLKAIARQEGLPASMARGDWSIPASADAVRAALRNRPELLERRKKTASAAKK